MLPKSVMDRFMEHCPAAVVVRVTLENLLRSERLDKIFEAARTPQSERRVLFSDLVAGMAMRTRAAVACGIPAGAGAVGSFTRGGV